jgi:hypothetical protein
LKKIVALAGRLLLRFPLRSRSLFPLSFSLPTSLRSFSFPPHTHHYYNNMAYQFSKVSEPEFERESSPGLPR